MLFFTAVCLTVYTVNVDVQTISYYDCVDMIYALVTYDIDMNDLGLQRLYLLTIRQSPNVMIRTHDNVIIQMYKQ